MKHYEKPIAEVVKITVDEEIMTYPTSGTVDKDDGGIPMT